MKYAAVAVLVALCVAPAMPSPAPQDRETLLEQLDREQQAILERVEKSIVRISSGGHAVVEFQINPPPASQRAWFTALGGADTHGILLSDGRVLTSSRCPAKNTTVTLADGRSLKAKIACQNESVGLTILTLDAKDLPPALEFGDDSKARRGSLVLVPQMRNGRTILKIDNVLDRVPPVGNRVSRTDFIELAESNGADGMPIFDARGRVVALLSANSMHNVYALATTAVNALGDPAYKLHGAQGFDPETWDEVDYGGPEGSAVPASTLRAFVEIVAKTGDFKRGVIGVRLDDKEGGVTVEGVEENTPAAKAGIVEGDVILALDGAPVKTVADCLRVIPFKTGEKLTVRVKHDKDEANVELTVVGEETRKNARTDALLGVDVMTLTEELKRLLGAEVEGVVVRRVLPSSPADQAGLKRYDIITAVGETPVKSREDFTNAVEALKDGAYSTWMVWRDNVESPTVVKVRR